jgi:hypothetical protein
MGENVFIFLIDLVHISELSLKLYVQVISLTTGRLVSGVAGAIERTTYLSRIFS